VLLLPAALATLPACAPPILIATAGASAAEATADAYVRGGYRMAEAYSIGIAQRATLTALSDLGMPAHRERSSEKYAEIFARTSDGYSVRVELIAKSDVVTRLNIRVGTFGDETLSQLIANTIRARLANPVRPGEAGVDGMIPP
jgi:hypothetical protein